MRSSVFPRTRTRTRTRLAAVAVAVGLVLGACSDDASTDAGTATTNGVVTTVAAATSSPLQVGPDGVSALPPSAVDEAIEELPVSSLTAAERDALRFMREEERLAEDVYRALFTRWQLPIFENIAAAEATHTASVQTLLERYGLADPTVGRAPGTYENATIQSLYDQLVAKGSASITAALAVGAEIEELDIADLRARSTTTPDIALVFANLEKGSRNHLRSFTSQLSSRGESYTPVHLAIDDYRAIVSSPAERGRAG
jgi:hypothetical protein